MTFLSVLIYNWYKCIIKDLLKYPHSPTAHSATYSPTKRPDVATNIAASTKLGCPSDLNGHIQHGPTNWCERRWARRSEGVTRSPLALSGLQDKIDEHHHTSQLLSRATRYTPFPQAKVVDLAIVLEDSMSRSTNAMEEARYFLNPRKCGHSETQ